MYYYHHDHRRHHRGRYIDLYAELNRIVKKIDALEAIVPNVDPTPYRVEIVVAERNPQYVEIPNIKGSN